MVICIDIGGTAIKYGVATAEGIFLTHGSVPTEAKEHGGAGIVRKVTAIVREALAAHTVKGVAISTAGMVDPQEGCIVYSLEDAIPSYTGTNWKALMHDTFGLLTSVENDVNCAGLGEYWLGAGLFAGSSERVNARENHMGEGYGFSARAVWRPINTDQTTVHFGFSAVARTPERVTSDDGIVAVGGRSGSVVENRKFIAGGFSGIDHYTICDLEAAYRDDRFFVQGEALCSTFATQERPGVITNGAKTYNIDGSESVSFWGGYLVGSYMLRGKQRSYSNSGAVFSNVNNEVEPGGNVELMIGASALDTQNYMGQAYEALGAVNWYPNTAMMLGLSYTFTSFSKDAVALGRLRSNSDDGLSYHTLQLRAQFVF